MNFIRNVFTTIAVLLASAMPALSSSKDAVRCVQNQLNAEGLNAGPADGIVGRKTRAAQDAFEAIFGPLTENPLTSEYAIVYCRLNGFEKVALKQYWPINKLDQTSKGLNLHIDNSISEGSTSEQLFALQVDRALSTAYEKLQNTLRYELVSPITVVVVSSEKDARKMSRRYLDRGGEKNISFPKKLCNSRSGIGGFATAGGIVLCRNPKFVDRHIDSAQLNSLITHEIVHLYQFQLSGGIHANSASMATRKFGPIWLREGSAHLIGEVVGHSITVAAFRSYVGNRLANETTVLPLWESKDVFRKGGQTGYELGGLAAAYLIPTGNYRHLINFYENFGRTGDWKVSFENVFGLDINTYYGEFQQRSN